MDDYNICTYLYELNKQKPLIITNIYSNPKFSKEERYD